MAELISTDNVVETTASGTWNAGDLRLAADGRVGIRVGGPPVASGEKVGLRMRGIIKATAGANLSAGAIVGAHITNQTILASGASGATDCGILLYDVTSGQPAYVDLNANFDRDT